VRRFRTADADVQDDMWRAGESWVLGPAFCWESGLEQETRGAVTFFVNESDAKSPQRTPKHFF
jgi:hypothetical protein